MSEQPFNAGGYIKAGGYLIAADRPEYVLTGWQWAVLGNIANLRAENIHPTISRSVRNVSRSMTFQQMPPQTRREKRQRNAFTRVLWGDALPAPAKPRQIIHNGRKP